MPEDLADQEYGCSFEGYQVGSYYGKVLRDMRAKGQIGEFPHVTELPVMTFWDLGIGDKMAVWFAQLIRNVPRVIHYHETEGEGLEYWARYLAERRYVYAGHYWPHDGTHREIGTGVAKRDTAEKLGIRPIEIVPRGDVQDGIYAVRAKLPEYHIDDKGCSKGVDCLQEYHKKWDEDRKEFQARPDHNWASHGADAFRTMVASDWQESFARGQGLGKVIRPAVVDFDPTLTISEQYQQDQQSQDWSPHEF